MNDSDPPPQRPVPPDPGDCCGGGCVRCVFDVYETALEAYDEAFAAWRLRHPRRGTGEGDRD